MSFGLRRRLRDGGGTHRGVPPLPYGRPAVVQPGYGRPAPERPAHEQPQVEQPQVEQPQVEQPQVEQPQVEERTTFAALAVPHLFAAPRAAAQDPVSVQGPESPAPIPKAPPSGPRCVRPRRWPS